MLRGHPHLIAYFTHHPRMHHRFIDTCHHYPVVMAHNLASRHYCHWLLSFMVSHHRLPGIDLLLGA